MNTKELHYTILNYKLHISILIVSIISLIIGTINIPVFNVFNIIILPIFYALFFSIILYISKKVKWITQRESKQVSHVILILICPLIAQLAIISGQNIHLLFNIGPILLLEAFGDLGTILLGLPIALLLGFGRESIGMTSSICREPQMAVLIEKYSFNSKEVKGFFMVYFIGLMLGAPIITLIIMFLCRLLPFSPLSYALASGVGSTSLNVVAISSLKTLYPYLTEDIIALGAISNMISLFLGIYIFIFISLPLTEKLFNILKKYI